MRVLHLEDDGPLREILAAALKAVEPNCELQQFIRSDDALTHINQHGQVIDLFIIDIRVPGSQDGLQVAQKIRELKCPGAIVVTSAYRVPDPTLLKQLDCEWFPKPWHIVETTTKLMNLAQKNWKKSESGAPTSSPVSAPDPTSAESIELPPDSEKSPPAGPSSSR